MFANPAQQIVPEEIHSPHQDLPHWLREMGLHHLMDGQQKQKIHVQSEAAAKFLIRKIKFTNLLFTEKKCCSYNIKY